MQTHYQLPCGRLASWLGCAFLLGCTTALAQTASDEEPIVLNPFVVTSQTDDSYRTEESNTATSIATKLADIPLSISVINDKRITEFSADSMDKIISKAPGVSTSTLFSNEVVVRGFATTTYVNGDNFSATSWAGKEIEFVDRIEIVKGPNAIFYGLIQPGGVVNTVTKMPLAKDQTVVGVSFGNQRFSRSYIDLNKTFLNNRLGVRVYAAYSDRDYYFESTDKTNTYLAGAVRYQIVKNLSLDFTLLYNDGNRKYIHSSPRSLKGFLAQTAVPPINSMRAWRTANNSAALYDTYAYDIVYPTLGIKGNAQGEGMGINRAEDFTKTANLVWRISDQFTNRLHYFTQAHVTEETSAGNEPNLDGTWTATAGNTFQRPYGWGLKDELVHMFERDSWKNKLLLGGERNQTISRLWAVGSAPTTIDVLHGERFTFANMGLVEGDLRNRSGVYTSFGDQVVSAYYAVDQLTLFDDRLHVLMGVRHTKAVTDSGSIAAVTGAITRTIVGRTASDTTFQTGIVYSPVKGTNFFASYSEVFQPQTGAINYDGTIMPPATGLGHEVGVKFSDSKKFTGTLSLYQSEITGQAIRDVVTETSRQLAGINPAGPIFILTGKQRVRGGEIEFDYTPTPEIQVTFGYSHIWWAATVANSASPAYIGKRLYNTPRHAINLTPRYEFKQGRLKGLYLGTNVEYKGAHQSHPDAIVVPLYNPAFTVVDIFAGYRMKISERPTTFRLNVNNLFDKVYYNGRNAPGNLREIRLSVETVF